MNGLNCFDEYLTSHLRNRTVWL